MDTIVLQTRPRKDPKGIRITYGVVGTGPGADAMNEAIRGLEHHPTSSERRALIDVLDLISRFNYRICFTEHTLEDGLEAWLFVLQG